MNKSCGRRLREIVAVLNRHKVVECFVKEQNPENVRMAFEELGPFFIKLGQILSLRTDIIAPAFSRELGKLQAHVKSDGFSVIKPLLEEAMSSAVEDVFAHLEEEALASASIAQVHKGYLKNGDAVVLKVQHPGTREMMLQDLKLLERALPFIKWVPTAKIVDPPKIIREIKDIFSSELDFRIQAEQMEKFRLNNLNVPYVSSPKAYLEYSSSTLLVMEYMEGASVSSYLNLAAQGEAIKPSAEQKAQFARYIAESYLKQVFEDGFFHADPHPGNILVNTKGEKLKIIYLDFGIMGTLEESMQKKLNEFMLAFANQNSERITQILLSLCHKSRPVDVSKLQESLAETLFEYFGMSLDELQLAELIRDITRLCCRYGLVFPENTAFLFKGLVTVTDILKQLDPTLSIMQMIQPHVDKYFQDNFKLKDELSEFAQNLILASKDAPKIPANFLELIRKTSSGKLRVTLIHEDLDKHVDRIVAMVNRLAIGIVLAAAILGFCLSLQLYTETFAVGVQMIRILIFFLIPFLTILFIFSFWRGRGRSKG